MSTDALGREGATRGLFERWQRDKDPRARGCLSAHVPRGAQELALKVLEAEQAISPRFGRSPTADELALYMEVSVEQVLDGLEAAAAHRATSPEEPHDELDGLSQSRADSFGEDDPRFEQIEASVTVESAARKLSEREQRVSRRATRDRADAPQPGALASHNGQGWRGC